MAWRRRRRGKYGAVKTTVGDITFDSKAEANVAQILELRRRAGEIRSWAHHPRKFLLAKCGEKRSEQCWYTPDYEVENRDFTLEYWDVKGKLQPGFKLKAILWRNTQLWPLVIVDREAKVIDIFKRATRGKHGSGRGSSPKA